MWSENKRMSTLVLCYQCGIHFGKGDRYALYKALSCLYQHHPVTLFADLIWLARPVIEKKGKTREEPKE